MRGAPASRIDTSRLAITCFDVADSDNDVRVFVSSTFRDMAAERDRLVRRVFPKLRQRCARSDISICEIDLRWGITADESRDGQVLRLCFAEIDRCLPFQICLLGDRYGWVDPDAPAKLRVLAPHLVPYASRSVTELEIRYGILNRVHAVPPVCCFYFRAPSAGDASDEPPESAERLAALKEAIRKSGYPVRENYQDAEQLAGYVLDDLWSAMRTRAEHAGAASNRGVADWRALVAPRARGFVPRSRFTRVLDRCAASIGAPILLHGLTGVGKTTLLSQWLRGRLRTPNEAVLVLPPTWRDGLADLFRWRRFQGQVAVVVFFAAAIDSALQATELAWAAIATSILRQLKEIAAIDESLPDLIAAVPGTIGRWLGLAAAKGGVVLVLDGLDEVLPEGSALDWLPATLPSRVTIVLSATSAGFSDRLTGLGWRRLPLRPLAKRERAQLTRDYLAAYGKRLSSAQQRQVLALQPAGNPLFLRTLLDQLRETGVHETLTDQLSAYRAVEDIPAMLDQALASIEALIDADKPGLVGQFVSLLGGARRGLTETEARELLGDETGRLPDRTWSPMRLALEPYFMRVEGILRFANRQVQLAAERRWLTEAAHRAAARRRLVAYFAADPTSPRGLEELPWLLATLENWDGLIELLARRNVLLMIQERRPFDLASFWVLIMANTAYRPEAVWRAVIEAPERDVTLAIAVATLLGDLGRIAPALSIAERLSTLRDESAVLVTVLGARIAILIESRRFDEAEPLLHRQIAICEKAGRLRERALALDNLALARLERGDVKDALTLQEQAEASHRQFSNDRALAVSFGIRATALFREGRQVEALAQWRRQETQARLVGDLRCLAASLGNQARLLLADGQYDAADRLCLDQERLSRQINDHVTLQLALSNRARVLSELDRFDEALALLAEREAIAERMDDCVGSVTAVLERALVFRRLGDERSTSTLFQRARRKVSGCEAELPFEARALFESLRGSVT
jgi:tetratricopeptide (TPR) repeat protein